MCCKVASVVSVASVGATDTFLAHAHFDLIGASLHEVGGRTIAGLFSIRYKFEGTRAFDKAVEIVISCIVPSCGIGATHEFAMMQFFAFGRKRDFMGDEARKGRDSVMRRVSPSGLPETGRRADRWNRGRDRFDER